MNKAALTTILASIAVMLVSACGGCPTTPSSTTDLSFLIQPSTAVVVVGTQQQFCASGPPTPYTWSVTGGGTIAPTTLLCAIFTAPGTVGVSQVTIRSASQSLTVAVQVVASK